MTDVLTKRSYLHFVYPDWKSEPGLEVADNFQLWHGPWKTFSVRFVDCDDKFEFPQAALSASFDYFKKLLRPANSQNSSSTWSELGDGGVNLTEVSSYEFGVLVTWLQSGLLKTPQDPAEAITACLSTISCADYLQMVNLAKYVEILNDFLTRTLRENRMALEKVHLTFMRKHELIFQTKAKSIGSLVAQAAVRPSLTCHLKSKVDTPAAAEWSKVIRHYEKLTTGSKAYSQKVMAESLSTLAKGKRRDKAFLRSKIISRATHRSTSPSIWSNIKPEFTASGFRYRPT
ncbi:hypothetical protein GE09DRAFT_1240235 [Coniochaeta sp. 2T2.1]|nr:hypothetical protein GE09DRAFT_1240235 [Coniochaeta sp. 2T2.1]